MRGQSSWQYHPYTRLDENPRKTLPYICRLAPQRDTCEVEWFDQGAPEAAHRLVCRLRGNCEPAIVMDLDAPCVRLEGLADAHEYEVFIERTEQPEARSCTRLFRTGAVPGTVVNYLHPYDDFFAFSGRYLCSPSIVQAPSGRLIVSMDVYGPRHAQNLTMLFKSDDGGSSWQYLCDLFPCFWGKLFIHQGRVYMLSVSAEYGELQVGYSTDEGEHWVKPVTLFPGAGIRDEKGMHQAPTPVVEHNGRIWSAVDYGTWEMGGHASALVSCDASTDLMNPADWTCSEFVPFDPTWPGAVPESVWGCLEGNAVVGPDGSVFDMLRYQITSVFADKRKRGSVTHGKALLLRIDQQNPEAPLQFERFVDLNGGMSKFVVKRDPVTGKYVSLVNEVLDDTTPAQRNVLTLAVSDDLVQWRLVRRIIDGSAYSTDEVGFQYVDFVFCGEDIVFASRTAFNHAHNFHDSNYITAHRIERFRALLG